MIRRAWIAALAVMLGVSANGCGAPAASSPEAAAVDSMTRHLSSSAGSYDVSYRTVPEPIPMNEPFEMAIVVQSANDGGRAARDVALAVDAAMPAHQHGMNTRPRVHALGDGRFRVEGMLFHMPGHWELYFDITEGAITERAQDRIDLE
ncbi:MAG: FixH family protein [Phycisphaerae bacterium]